VTYGNDLLETSHIVEFGFDDLFFDFAAMPDHMCVCETCTSSPRLGKQILLYPSSRRTTPQGERKGEKREEEKRERESHTQKEDTHKHTHTQRQMEREREYVCVCERIVERGCVFL
jgi:hypothetical protein